MFEGYRIGAILLMGGIGRRFGSDTPKQFHRLAGKPVFLHTLETFLSTHLFDEIVLSCHPDWIDAARQMLPIAKCPIRVVKAGLTRQESSWTGLQGFVQPPDFVVIHDAVRPFVTQDIIIQNIMKSVEIGAADTCIPSMDTLVLAPEKEIIQSIPKRSDYLRGQTPQTFSYSLIVEAHRKATRQDSSDDCQLALDLGHPVGIVAGDEHNIKITSGLDLFFAEQLIRHRFADRKSGPPISLSGRRYAIVGGTGGIGRAIETQIRALGGETIPLSRKTTPISIDLCDPMSIEQAFGQIAKCFGPLDGLVNCAGRLSVASLDRLTLHEINQSIDVNLKGLILCCQKALLKKGAHVINIASSSFSRGRPQTTIYSSAKAGVVNFTQGWAEERPDLHIHAVIPQRTNTSMRRQNFPNEDAAALLDPQNVARMAVDLLMHNDITGLLVEVRKNCAPF